MPFIQGIQGTLVQGIQGTLLLIDGFESPCRQVRLLELLVVLVLNDVRESIVSDDFVELPN